MMLLKILAVLQIFMGHQLAIAFETRTYTKSLKCISDPRVATNPICQVKAVSRAVQKLRFGFTVVEQTDDVFVSLVGYVKTSANRFMPGFWKLAQNFCNLFSQRNAQTDFFLDAIGKLNPNINLEKMKPYQCPWKGTLFVEAIQYKNVTEIQFLVPPNEYKNIWRLYNSQNETYYQLDEIIVQRDMSRQS